jgi:hypothetical protein
LEILLFHAHDTTIIIHMHINIIDHDHGNKILSTISVFVSCLGFSMFKTYFFQTHHMLPLYMARVFIFNRNGSTWWYTHIIKKHLDRLSLIWEIYDGLSHQTNLFFFCSRHQNRMCFPLPTKIIFCKQLPLSFQPNHKVF